MHRTSQSQTTLIYLILLAAQIDFYKAFENYNHTLPTDQ